jgi:16S rRNA (cytosine967-C5)-methyltransferase
VTPRRTPRQVAIEALVRVEGGAYSNLLVPALLRGTRLDARDRAFTADLVYTTLREQRLADHVLVPHLRRDLATLDADVRAALRLGVTQLRLGVPPHAAVRETVEALGRRNPRGRGFVNAVLRATAADETGWAGPAGDDPASLAIRTSHPDWLVERLVAELGAVDARAVLESDNRPPRLTLRPNPRRAGAAGLARELAAAGGRVEPAALVAEAVPVAGVGDPASLAAVADGRATPQDEASQAVVVELDPREGERVLEVAAAPGGKATAIAERVGPDGFVAAVDVHEGRAGRIREAAHRLGLANVAVVVADGRALPWRQGRFDRVLLDAPCSGLGVLRRRAEARFRLAPDAPEALAARQRELAPAALASARPGGRFVYSVCTLTSVETTAIDDALATARPDCPALAPPGPPWRRAGRGALLLPSAAGTDGMFVLKLAVGERAPAGSR